MTESEAVALRWVRKYLIGHHCPRCDREWITGSSTKVLMHHCSPPPGRYDWRPPRERRDDERRAWALTTLGAAIEDGLGDRAYLDVAGEEE